MTQLSATNEPYIVDFVPDEVCVVVTAPADADGRRLYEQVHRTLNRVLSEREQQIAAGPPQSLTNDFVPAQLADRLDESGGQLLRPLARSGINPDVDASRSDDATRPPWVVLPRPSTNEAHWHFYFHVGLDRLDLRSALLEDRQRRLTSIRQLVNVINLSQPGRGETLVGDDWLVSGASPNWLTTAHDFSCAGPAALPHAEREKGRWRFKFADKIQSQLAQGPSDANPMVVAILDTCPDPAYFEARGNPYLQQVWDDIQVDYESPPALHTAYFDRPRGLSAYSTDCLPWWHEGMPRDPAERDGFAMADHGLFVAGIVHDIVGGAGASIRLIRVLNDHGVGDLLAISHVLEDLPGVVFGEADGGLRGPRLIVNLSLGAVPSQMKHRARWLPTLHESLERDAASSPPQDAQDLLDAAHLSLREAIEWLHANNVLVVASAGNDALRDFARGAPPPPRYPAHYPNVFAVAATNAEGRPAIYSNRTDAAPKRGANGVATFGGDAVVPESPLQPPLTETGRSAAGRANAVVGLYSSQRLPGGALNRTGWVQWAGTSFAAPVISGLAARVWAHRPEYAADLLMEHIRGFAQWSDETSPLDAPVVDAWQVHQLET